MAGVTGLEPATSGVTGQRSNQLSYTPQRSRDGRREIKLMRRMRQPFQRGRVKKVIRATDAKEVGVENPLKKRSVARIRKLGVEISCQRSAGMSTCDWAGLNWTHFSRDNSDFIRIFPPLTRLTPSSSG